MTSARELKDRWSGERAAEANRRIGLGAAPDIFGRTEAGYLDLRGLVLSHFFQNVSLEHVDLSFCGAKGAGQFMNCRLEDVIFERGEAPAKLYGRYLDCRFAKAKMKGVWLGGVFERCDFSGANLDNAGAEQVALRDCNFSGADLRRAHLCNCTFENCVWDGAKFGKGSFYRSRFVGAAPGDLEDTIMDRVVFE